VHVDARLQLYMRELDACAHSLDKMKQRIAPGDALQRFHLAKLRSRLARTGNCPTC